MKVFIYTTVFVCFLNALSMAQDASLSPMPSMVPTRPSIPKLFLSTAGKAPFTELPIVPFTRLNVCPSDYDMGFSVRCEVTGAKTVSWRVRGQLHKKEYFAPYYLSGNFRDQVGPYRGFDSLPIGSRLRVACVVRKRKPVWIDLIKSC